MTDRDALPMTSGSGWGHTEIKEALRPPDRTRPRTAEPAEPGLDYEAFRMERGWPTPNHMRAAADALDTFTPARYGDVLRWFADLADASLDARLGAEKLEADHE